MSFAPRFARFLAAAGMDQSELARKLGISSQAVNQWVTGDTGPSRKRQLQVAAILGVTLDELLGLPDEAGKSNNQGLPAVEHSTATVKVQELDVVAQGGFGGADIDEAGGHVVLAEWQLPGDYLRSHCRTPSAIKIVRVSGDSMEPEYPSGDRVLVDTSHRVPSPPGIYVLWDGYGLVLKRLEVIQGGDTPLVRISSSNPAYPPYERPPEALAINGRVMGKWMWK